MRRFFKFLIWLVGFVLITLVLLAIALPIFFDPNDYKPQIIEQVEQRTGRSLTLDGDIDWRVFPWLALATGPITLGNDPGFEGDYLLRAERISAGLQLWPLLESRIEIGAVELDGVDLNLEVNAAGDNNWSSIAERAAAAPTDPAEEASSGGYGLSVESFALTRSQISYRDAAAELAVLLSAVNLTSGAISPADPIQLDLKANYDFNQAQRGLVAAQIEARNVFSDQLPDLRLTRVRITQEAEPQLQVSMPGINLDLAAGTLNVPELEIDSHGAHLTGRINGRDLLDTPRFSGVLTVAEFAPDQWLAATGLYAVATTDPSALDSLAGEVEWRVDDGVFLDKVRLQLDDTLLRGSASVNDGLRFEMQADQLVLDRYLPPASDAPPPPADVPEEPLQLPRLTGALSVGEFTMAGMTASEVLLRLEGDEDGIRVLPIRGRAYGGQFEGSLDLRDARDAAKAATQLRVNRVDGGALLGALAGSSVLSGVGNLQADVSIDEPFAANPLASLNGNVSFAFRDGKIHGVDIMQVFNQVAALTGGGQGQQTGGELSTDYGSLDLAATITNGVLQTNDFAVVTDLLRISGAGTVNLAAGTLDYTLRPTLLQLPEGQESSYLARLQGKEIPISLTGSLTAPKVGFDAESVLKGELEDRLLERLGGEGKDGEEEDPLKALLRGALQDREKKKDDDNDS